MKTLQAILLAGVIALPLSVFSQKRVTRTLTVGNDAQINIALLNSSGIDCLGNQGSIDVAVTGGIGTLTYSWTGPSGFTSTDQNLSGLIDAGNYTITADDGNGCPVSSNFSIGYSCPYTCSGFSLEVINIADPTTCSSTNGSFDIEITGGAAPFFYEVSHVTLTSTVISSGSTASSTIPLTGLPQGTFEISVRDANDCEVYASHLFTSPFYLYEGYLTGTNTDCNLSNAELNLTVIGAAFPENFSIKWYNTYTNTTITTTAPELDNVYPGYYVIEVTDLNAGCVTYGNASVDNYMIPLYITTNSITPTTQCTSPNGAIDISVTGGSGGPSYQYFWQLPGEPSFNASSQDVSNLVPGEYVINVVDTQAGCSKYETILVPDQRAMPLVMLDSSTPNTSCSSPFNGALNITAAETPGPYSFSWVDESGGVISTQQDPSGLAPGIYGITVTDLTTGCQTSVPTTDPEAPSVSDNSIPAITIETVINDNRNCGSPYDGSINLIIGTSSSYSVFWEGPHDFESTDENIADLRPGEYYLTVTLPCSGNNPPVITPPALAVQTGTSLTLDLLDIVSDPDDNLDPSTLEILDQPLSGANASIDASFNLKLDYTGITFKGTDQLRIQACDDLAACTDNILSIEVDVTATGEIMVYNAVAPSSTGDNKFMRIINLPEGNTVSVFNRWGDRVFQVINYDNLTRRFEGMNDNGKALPTGTYFYTIELPNGQKEHIGLFVFETIVIINVNVHEENSTWFYFIGCRPSGTGTDRSALCAVSNESAYD